MDYTRVYTRFLNDVRFGRLLRSGVGDKRQVMGSMVFVWLACMQTETDTLTAEDIDHAAEIDGFAEALLVADLCTAFGRKPKNGRTRLLRVRGAREVLDTILSARERARIAALAKHNRKKPETSGVLEHEQESEDPAPPGVRAAGTPALHAKEVRKEGRKKGSPSGGLRGGEQPPLPGVPAPAEPPEAVARKEVFGAWRRLYQERTGKGAVLEGMQSAALNRCLEFADGDAAEVVARIEHLFRSPPRFLSGHPPDPATLAQHWDKLTVGAPSPISTAPPVDDDPLGVKAAAERLNRIERERGHTC